MKMFSNHSNAMDHQQHIRMAKNTLKNTFTIYCCFLVQTSHLINPEHQEHLQNYIEPPENCFRIIQTQWTTNNTFGRPKIHSKTHSQYNIYRILPLSFSNFTS